MLTQADNITRMKLHFAPQHLTVPGDQRALARGEGCGADMAVTLKAAVSWKDVVGEETEIRLCSFFIFSVSAK